MTTPRQRSRPAPAPGDTQPAPVSPGKDHDLAPRASFPLTADKSRINVAKLQDKSKEQLRQLLSDPELPAQLGLSTAALPAAGALPGGDGFPPELCGVIFDAINMVVRAKYATLGERAQRLGIPDNLKADGAAKAAKVIDKYAPNSLGKYALEADLGLWVVAVLAANLAIIRAPQAAPVAPVRQAEPAAQEQEQEQAQFPRSVKM